MRGSDLEVVVLGPPAGLARLPGQFHQFGRRLGIDPVDLAQIPDIAQRGPARAGFGAADLRRRTEELLGDILDREALRGPEFAQPHAEFALANGRTQIRHAAPPSLVTRMTGLARG